MPIRVLEQFVRGKQADQSLCEDRLVVTSHFVAVIDGVTSKSAYTWQGESSGVHAGKLIEQGGFTGSGLAIDTANLPLRNGEIDTFQCYDGLIEHWIFLA